MTDYTTPHAIKFLKDLAEITVSGPHEIGPEQREFNKQVYEECQDIIPFDDIHKKSDCDLIYKFGIARKWDVDLTVKNLHEYIEFREEHSLNEILWSELPEEALAVRCRWQGFDKFNNPVFYDKPDPKLIGILLTKLPREVLLRVHFMVMEQGRRWCLSHGGDRVTCVMDLQMCGSAVLTNAKAIGFLKEISKLDQHHYPENMRTMCILNGGWTFSGI